MGHLRPASRLESFLDALLGLFGSTHRDQGLAVDRVRPHRVDRLVGSFEDLLDFAGEPEDLFVVSCLLGNVRAHPTGFDLAGLEPVSLGPPEPEAHDLVRLLEPAGVGGRLRFPATEKNGQAFVAQTLGQIKAFAGGRLDSSQITLAEPGKRDAEIVPGEAIGGTGSSR